VCRGGPSTACRWACPSSGRAAAIQCSWPWRRRWRPADDRRTSVRRLGRRAAPRGPPSVDGGRRGVGHAGDRLRPLFFVPGLFRGAAGGVRLVPWGHRSGVLDLVDRAGGVLARGGDLIARWFTERRGSMMGLAFSGMGAGVLVIGP